MTFESYKATPVVGLSRSQESIISPNAAYNPLCPMYETMQRKSNFSYKHIINAVLFV